MKRSLHQKRVRCTQCQYEAVWGPEAIATRLREMGHLRRDHQPTIEWVEAVAAAVSDQFPCTRCGATGLVWDDVSDDDADFDVETLARPCEVCRQPIPRERLEVYRQATRCARCQDQPAQPVDAADFCPRCGSVLEVRPRRGAGVARYAQTCPACGYRGK
jgi:DNA-directed RNA polymerase subunit M/transcription elongation factor TFIIS